MHSRLVFSVIFSIALHGIFLASSRVKSPAAQSSRPLLAVLPPAEIHAVDEPPIEPLLKNTIEQDKTVLKPKNALERSASRKAAKSTNASKRERDAFQQKIAKQLFYPPQAVAQGIEGDVWLILRLADDGQILDVKVATSSGSALLDNAAIRAAYAMGKQTGASSNELIVPVSFRLE